MKKHNTYYKLHNTSMKGFTLLEVIIYMGLVAIVIGGALISTYPIITGQYNLNKKVYAYDEADFLNRKVEWALSEVSAINYPLPNTNGAYISINKSNYSQNPVIIDLSNGQLRIKKGTGLAVPLNSSLSNVSTVSFKFDRVVGQSSANIITASFYVDGKYFETKRMVSR